MPGNRPYAFRGCAGASNRTGVFRDRVPRKQRIILEYHSSIWTRPSSRPTTHEQLAQRRLFKPRDAAQERALAASARTEQADEATGWDCHVQVVQHLKPVASNRKRLP